MPKTTEAKRTIPHGNSNPKYTAIKEAVKKIKVSGGCVRWKDPPANPYATVRSWENFIGFVPIVQRTRNQVWLYRP